MAEVYKAYQPSLDRYVAIKIMHAFLAREPDFLGRFEREAKSVAALQHPNIIQLHDFDVHNGMPYMVMEFIEGGTLKTQVEKLRSTHQRLALPEAVRVVREVGRALAYAHQRGMIHRDVKPANVLLGTGGRVILSDFGIAKILTGPSFTMTGATVGTPAYMSPEQSLGHPGDHRSDLYSLGVVLYQLALGDLPYDADTPMALMLKHVNEPVPVPRTLRADLPEGLERIIVKALAKNPEDRFQSAEEMLAQLDNLETVVRLTPLPPTPAKPATPPPQGATVLMEPPAVNDSAAGAPAVGAGAAGAPARRGGRPWFLAALSLPVLALLCVGLGAGGLLLAYMAGVFGTPTPEQPTVLFQDDFSTTDNGWPTGEDENTRSDFRSGKYVLELLVDKWMIWSTPNMDTVSNVRVAVTVANLGADDASFGVVCNFVDNESFYYLGFGEDGYYAIVRVDGQDDVFLTSDENKWEQSGAIAQNESTYEMEAECASDGTFRLYVDGAEIAEAHDDAFTEGTVGVFASSFDNAPVEVTFDDLVVTPLD
jgi:hypothetical protein